MEIMHNGRKTTIGSLDDLANVVKYEDSLITLEVVHDVGRDNELMEALNEKFDNYKYSLVEVEEYLTNKMYSEDAWSELWE